MRREVEIMNELGLHARPAAEFVRAVQEFDSEVVIHKNGATYSGASIIEVLTANLDCGERVVLEATGRDEALVLDRLEGLLEELREHEAREH